MLAELPGGEEFFDADWYRERYPDIAGDDPWIHFLRHGEQERRSPGPTFDSEFYARTYLALEEQHALRHYLDTGRHEGALPRPIHRNRAQSEDEMRRVLADVAFPFILVGNDAQRAGGPLLLLEIARHLRRRGFTPVFLLDRAGPVLHGFRALGPTLVLAEGYDLPGLGGGIADGTPVLANTGWAAPILEGLGYEGPRILLVHEMPDYLAQQDLLESVGRARVLVAGLPGVAQALTERLPTAPHVETVTPGLLHVTSGPASTARVGQMLRERFGADHLLFVGAGYADRRKGFDRFLTLAGELVQRDSRSVFVWLGELSTWARDLADAAIAGGLPLFLPGFRLDAHAWYDHAAVYLLTSRQDPGPTTVIDAARRGVPFVTAPGDLGLESLGRVLDGVGTFANEGEDVAGLALDLAANSTAAGREARASHIEALASFPRYVDDLVGLLRQQGRLNEPD